MDQQENKPEGLGTTERQLLSALIRTNKIVIKVDDVLQLTSYSRDAANLMLSSLCRKGWLQRLKRGTYRVLSISTGDVDPIPDDPWAIAASLFAPAVISGWSAAEHWGLTEQIFNSTVVITGQRVPEQDVVIAGLHYHLKYRSAANNFGTERLFSNNQAIEIADIHRTLIDMLDDPSIAGGGQFLLEMVRTYSQDPNANLNTLWQYAIRLNRGGVYRRLGFVAEKWLHAPTTLFSEIEKKIKKGVIKFDPKGTSEGPIVSRWGLQLNVAIGDET